MRRIVKALCVVGLVWGAAACSDEDASDTVIQSAGTSSTTSTSAEVATTSTTVFEGSTSPTSALSTATHVALLTDVQVGDGVVTFTFRDDLPGYDVGYVAPPILQDGSGEPIDVAGAAFLNIRLEPASGVDLSGSGEDFEETYTGPERVTGAGVIAEVVRTGDFEANLTWVVGLDRERAYRVEADASMLRVYFST